MRESLLSSAVGSWLACYALAMVWPGAATDVYGSLGVVVLSQWQCGGFSWDGGAEFSWTSLTALDLLGGVIAVLAASLHWWPCPDYVARPLFGVLLIASFGLCADRIGFIVPQAGPGSYKAPEQWPFNVEKPKAPPGFSNGSASSWNSRET